MRIALFTDQGAHYRLPVFEAIEASTPRGSSIDFYIPSNDSKGLKVFETTSNLKSFCRNKNINYKGRIIYQTKAVLAACSPKYDAILLWGTANIFSNWVASFCAKLTGKRLILWGHGLYGNESRMIHYFRVSFYRRADLHFLYGHHGQQLVDAALTGSNTSVIFNSLNVEKIRAYVESCSNAARGSEWDLIFVGRITKIKNIELLLDACGILKSKGSELRVLVVGDGVHREALVRRSAELGIADWFEWVGACYDDQVLAHYFRKSKFCISPGNIGLMAMHALYNETPVITHSDMIHQMPEAEAITEGVNGFLFDYDSSESLASTLVRAITEYEQNLFDSCYSTVANTYNPLHQVKVFWNEVGKLKL